MKSVLKCLALSIASVFCVSSAFAGSFATTISGLPDPSGIETMKVRLQVSGDFSLTSALMFGDAIPSADATKLPWSFVSTSPAPSGGLLTVDLFNGDAFDGLLPFGNLDSAYSENNLLNGTMFTFDFNGMVLGVDAVQAFDAGGMTIQSVDLPLTASLQGDTLAISNVPIPGSVLLLGSGLAGLAGLRRRKLQG